jgi:hypothetical protein
MLGTQADLQQEFHHPLAAPARRHVHDIAMDHQRLSDDVMDRHARIERRVRILENDLQPRTQSAHLNRRQLVDI